MDAYRDYDGKLLKTNFTKAIITKLNNDYGLINSVVYFERSAKICTEFIPRVGMKVDVVCERKTETDCWIVTYMNACDDDDVVDLDKINRIGSVKFYDILNQIGYTEENHKFKYADVIKDHESYMPFPGDTIRIKMKKGIKEVEAIQSVRSMEFHGIVRRISNDHGYIEDVKGMFNTYYHVNSCKIYEKLVRNKYVKCLAVGIVEHLKSQQCKWRVYEVMAPDEQTDAANSYIRHDDDVLSLTDADRNKLLMPKHQISISGITDFGPSEPGHEKENTITISNKGSDVQTLKRIKMANINCQFSITTAEFQNNGDDVYTLRAGHGLDFTLQCGSKFHGLDKRMLILDFDTFQYAIYVEVNVCDLETYYKLRPTVEYRKSERSYNDEIGTYIPGPRPKMNKKHKKRRGKKREVVSKRPVSDLIKNCILREEDELELKPCLIEDLNILNYEDKLNTLIDMNDIACQLDLSQYDRENVIFTPGPNNTLSMFSEDLQEFRPSVIKGDSMIIKRQCDKLNDNAIPYEAIVHEVSFDKIYFMCDETFMNTYRGDEYCCQFLYNRVTSKREIGAINLAPQLGNNVIFPNSLIIQNKYADAPTIYFNKLLNERQRNAVDRIVEAKCRPTPYILFGPPGTGKTITLVEAILQVLKLVKDSRILVTAGSNSATDLLCERLADGGIIPWQMFRMNAASRNIQRVPEKIRKFCEEDNFTLERRIIVTTCSSAMFLHEILSPGHFTHVFIDESGQLRESETLIPMTLLVGTMGQLVLSGDPFQLGPVISCEKANEYGMNISMLERLSKLSIYRRNTKKFSDYGNYDPFLITKLVENYRSHPKLVELPSRMFYNSELKAVSDPAMVNKLTQWDGLRTQGCPMIFHGIRGDEKREGNSPSWFNPQEITEVIEYIKKITTGPNKVQPEDIGVISPYKQQANKIKSLLSAFHLPPVKVGSVEEFQGQEKTVIILTTVRSQEENVKNDMKYRIGFLKNPKRFNVGITRAIALLIIIGNPHLLVYDKYWQDLIQFCIHNKCYKGCNLPETVNWAESRVGDDLVGDPCEEQSDSSSEEDDEDRPTEIMWGVKKVPEVSCGPFQVKVKPMPYVQKTDVKKKKKEPVAKAPEVKLNKEVVVKAPEVKLNKEVVAKAPEVKLNKDVIVKAPKVKLNKDVIVKAPEVKLNKEVVVKAPEVKLNKDVVVKAPEVKLNKDVFIVKELSNQFDDLDLNIGSANNRISPEKKPVQSSTAKGILPKTISNNNDSQENDAIFTQFQYLDEITEKTVQTKATQLSSHNVAKLSAPSTNSRTNLDTQSSIDDIFMQFDRLNINMAERTDLNKPALSPIKNNPITNPTTTSAGRGAGSQKYFKDLYDYIDDIYIEEDSGTDDSGPITPVSPTPPLKEVKLTSVCGDSSTSVVHSELTWPSDMVTDASISHQGESALVDITASTPNDEYTSPPLVDTTTDLDTPASTIAHQVASLDTDTAAEISDYLNPDVMDNIEKYLKNSQENRPNYERRTTMSEIGSTFVHDDDMMAIDSVSMIGARGDNDDDNFEQRVALDVRTKILKQVQYYFSVSNIIQDAYLKKFMDAHNSVPVKFVLSFKKMKELIQDENEFIEMINQYGKTISVEISKNGQRIRPSVPLVLDKDEWMKNILSRSLIFAKIKPQGYSSFKSFTDDLYAEFVPYGMIEYLQPIIRRFSDSKKYDLHFCVYVNREDADTASRNNTNYKYYNRYGSIATKVINWVYNKNVQHVVVKQLPTLRNNMHEEMDLQDCSLHLLDSQYQQKAVSSTSLSNQQNKQKRVPSTTQQQQQQQPQHPYLSRKVLDRHMSSGEGSTSGVSNSRGDQTEISMATSHTSSFGRGSGINTNQNTGGKGCEVGQRGGNASPNNRPKPRFTGAESSVGGDSSMFSVLDYYRTPVPLARAKVTSFADIDTRTSTMNTGEEGVIGGTEVCLGRPDDTSSSDDDSSGDEYDDFC